MIRSILISVLALSGPFQAFADKKYDPRVEEILDQLPTEAEIEEVLSAMPDMNKMVTGMMDIAKDPETIETLERVGTRLEERFSSLELHVEDGEMPDFNNMMGEVMGLASDRETIGDVLGLMFQFIDVMEESVGEIER